MSELTRLEGEIRKALEAQTGLPPPNPTESYWQHEPHALAEVQSASLPSTADVAIIGSGMTAVSVAKTLLETDPDVHVAVIEARRLCSGATGRNGGHLKSDAVMSFSSLRERFGEVEALRIVKYQKMNVDRVRQVAKEYCPRESELRDVEAVVGCQDQTTLDRLRASVDAYKATQPSGSVRYQFTDGDTAMKEYGMHGVVGALTMPAGAMWPYRLVTKVWEALLAKYPTRLSIETLTPVEHISCRQEPTKSFVLSTPRGEVHAGRVIHCTNGHAGHLIPSLNGKLFPLRGTMTVQEKGERLPHLGATRSWSFKSKPTYDPARGLLKFGLTYLTQNPFTGYLFFGGEQAAIRDLLTHDDTKLSGSSKTYLEDQLPAGLGLENGWKQPRSTGIISAWSGIMGFTGDGVPMVGEIPCSQTPRGMPGEYLAAGFNGYGMATCWMAGEIIAQIALGRGFPECLPESYKLTEERLQRLTVELAVASLSGGLETEEASEPGRASGPIL